MRKVDQAAGLIDAGNYSAAESLIDQESTDPVLRSFLAPLKLQCLVHRDAKALAVDMAVAILADEYGIIVFSTDDLRQPLDFAIDLNRTSDAHQIASGILAHQTSQFSAYASLHTPVEESNPTKRLAYGYLVIGDNRGAKKDIAGKISYNLKAKVLMPNDPMVLIRLAASYGDRGVGSDLQQCKDLLILAYNQAPAGSELRAAAQDFAHRFGLGNIP